MEKHKKYILFSLDDNYFIQGEFDTQKELEEYILVCGSDVHYLLAAVFTPINITLEIPNLLFDE